jgi:hypothetical protein
MTRAPVHPAGWAVWPSPQVPGDWLWQAWQGWGAQTWARGNAESREQARERALAAYRAMLPAERPQRHLRAV